MNLAQLLARAAGVFATAPALSKGPHLFATYAGLAARCARLAGALRTRCGLVPGTGSRCS
ncbi:MAG: hypothetical protein M5U08_14540 [Burkholderiales bacterium]|nr:hypothetical protein [Burkholderiales bacterium]